MEQNTQSKFMLPLAIVIAGAFVAIAIYYGDKSGANNQLPTTNNQQQVDIAAVTAEDHILGSRNAPIIIVEYSDTECPFCKTFHNTMKQVLSEYGDQVAWVYRHFPIAQLHARAHKEAEATECAAKLGGNQAFWNYIDKVFETTKSNDSLDPSELPKIAGAIGLDVTAFNTCLNSGEMKATIDESIEAAVKAGARGTPYSVIVTKGGQKVTINGAEPLANVKAKIDSLLK